MQHAPVSSSAQARTFFRRLEKLRPEPTTELHYRNPFELLVAVVLSAQTTDVAVNKVTPALFKVAPDARSMARLGRDGVERHIRSIGLYRSKARHLAAACKLLLEHHGGEVPEHREQLEALPGVGRKTANVILNTAFGQATIAVDTHIFRVANRTGLAPGRTPLEVEQRLLEVVPERYRRHAHHWLILHGRYTCRARTPLCAECPVWDCCAWPQRGASPPATGRRRKPLKNGPEQGKNTRRDDGQLF